MRLFTEVLPTQLVPRPVLLPLGQVAADPVSRFQKPDTAPEVEGDTVTGGKSGRAGAGLTAGRPNGAGSSRNDGRDRPGI
jgi:hypothetical protein